MFTEKRTATWLVVLLNTLLVGVAATVLADAAPAKLAVAATAFGIGLVAINVAIFYAVARSRGPGGGGPWRVPTVWRMIGVIYSCGALYGVAMVLLGQLAWPYLGAVAFSGIIVWRAFRRAAKSGQPS